MAKQNRVLHIPDHRDQKTGVLVHGYNLNASLWESVTWGSSKDQMGRIPMGIFVALSEKAEALILGSGASEREGIKESEAGALMMRNRFDGLTDFPLFKKFFPKLKNSNSALKYKNQIESILHLDRISTNTIEELENAGRFFLKQNIDRIVVISSPTHLPRCIRDACRVFEENKDLSYFRNQIYAVPSVTGFPGYAASDVTIFEPPHRPDRSPLNISSVVSRIHKIPDSARGTFIQRLEKLLADFQV